MIRKKSVLAFILICVLFLATYGRIAIAGWIWVLGWMLILLFPIVHAILHSVFLFKFTAINTSQLKAIFYSHLSFLLFFAMQYDMGDGPVHVVLFRLINTVSPSLSNKLYLLFEDHLPVILLVLFVNLVLSEALLFKKYLSAVPILLAASSIFFFGFALNNKTAFQESVAKAGMQLAIPEGFNKTSVKKNLDQSYDFAVKNKKLKTEIRYKIWLYDSVMKEMEVKTPGNVFSKTQMWVIVRNLTAGKREDYIEFPQESVKSEFGADWGATASVEMSCSFGKGYRYCTVTALHKNSVADAYIFYLYDDPIFSQKMFNDLGNNWFYTLRFIAK